MDSLKRNILITESQLHWMFRYCLSRNSYAVADGINAIEENLNVISPEEKLLLIKEIEEYLELDKTFAYRFECDAEAWKALKEKLKNET